MTIWLNGVETRVETTRLDQLIDDLGYGAAKVATALNGDFVPKAQRPTTEVKPGDRLEILAPLQGG
ncbi:MAG: sulfur carrier protein ThiS [Pseudomonadota bacterium]